MSGAAHFDRFRQLVGALGDIASQDIEETLLLRCVSSLVGQLLRHDDWLPAAYAEPDPLRYRQYLLHCDSRERFSVVSFVWSPGQSTPVHDHGVWGVVGVLRGVEISQAYRHTADGLLAACGEPTRLGPGDIETLSPAKGDIHRVMNGSDSDVAVSIHVYGGNIGRITRRMFDDEGHARPFITRFHNDQLPNIWN